MRGGGSELRCRIIPRVLVVGRVVRPLRACSTAGVAVGALVLRMEVVPAIVTGIAGRGVSPRVGLTQNTGGVNEGVLVRFYLVTPSAVVKAVSAIRAKGWSLARKQWGGGSKGREVEGGGHGDVVVQQRLRCHSEH